LRIGLESSVVLRIAPQHALSIGANQSEPNTVVRQARPTASVGAVLRRCADPGHDSSP
jgi:hypothetical protein